MYINIENGEIEIVIEIEELAYQVKKKKNILKNN